VDNHSIGFVAVSAAFEPCAYLHMGAIGIWIGAGIFRERSRFEAVSAFLTE
jgi:hypothetical protein